MTWRYSASNLARILGITDASVETLARSFSAVSTDTRTIGLEQAFFALKGENFDGNQYVEQALEKGAAFAVTSQPGPGCRLVTPDPLAALQTFAARHRDTYERPLLAITGSCGKTSAKDCIAALLETRYNVVKTQGNLNNDIGCPRSLLGINGDTEMAVIEMGANHAGEIAQLCQWARPTEALVTMVGPAHLEGFGSVENVAKAKAEIVEGLQGRGRFYVNNDDPWCRRMAEDFPGEKIRFGAEGEVALRSCEPLSSGGFALDIDPIGRLKLPLFVRAQVSNILAAIAVALQHGITEFEEPLRRACKESSRARMLQVGPLMVLEDAYNANPSSMDAALQAVAEHPAPGRRFAALGEMLELGEAAEELHRGLGEKAAEAGVARLYARGPHAYAMIEGARERGLADAEVMQAHHAMADAIYAEARAGDLLLLKGSRGMKMETVLEALRQRYEPLAKEK
jgi:UDP-N-acetylmuramoyl-tripeptide--D-alanyl-D-alanine ligase